MAKTKIALFGGAFDPPHLGHSQVAENLISQKIVDEVWFVPVYKHPWAKKLHKEFLTPYSQRVKMLELLVEAVNQKAENSAKIAHFKDVSYTYDTLIYFSQKYPEHEFFWVMGSEYLSKFDAFLETHPKLLDFTFYIYPRVGFELEPIYDNMIALKNMPEIEISSTMVRERVKDEENVEELVEDGVRDKIIEWKLYA